ncbi:MAG TPA: PTS sugar transporter subunit IIA [Spirochaetota bacterium]|nr:PTS sugar transporter subunit IIA [Spirochaetota bacterium]HOM10927.1 PTS sugar transporter subunit IIA [Spirochaetota bacterium]HPP48617.1 PTS sugar transporter subunit IIA [Spirochaetota bacterium]HXK65176.1 PTS sugar transporter subunit IIA [Spirochaetota bacterium]
MVLTDYLNKKTILINPSVKDRWELIESMLDVAIKNKAVKSEYRETIKKTLFEREKSMSTGIGKGVAIPHCSCPYVDDVVMILALSKKGINFDSIDNLPVHIAILLIVPKDKISQHIKTLANIAKLMSDDALREALSNAKDAQDIIKILKEYEQKGKKQ